MRGHRLAVRLLINRCLWGCVLSALSLVATMAPSVQAAPLPIENLLAVSSAGNRSCAIDAGGMVLCWGLNNAGDLGTGATGNVMLPQPVLGLPGAMTAVAVGTNHACAVDQTGAVWCWGDNDFGQLGDGSTDARAAPVQVVGLGAPVVTLAGGSRSACALTDVGDVACWGDNSYGQLGDGTTTERHSATFIASLAGAGAKVTLGMNHGCARTTAGAALCWGRNNHGQLGDGTSTQRLTPTPVSGLGSAVIDIDGGDYHSCAVLNDGSVRCWGSNEGALGNGGTTDEALPVPVSGVSAAVAVSLGSDYGCALKSTGAAMCWGENTFGTLGDGSLVSPRLTPVAVLGYTDFTALTAADAHTCGLRGGGRLVCWGGNLSGQTGTGDPNFLAQATPVPLAGTSGRELALGAAHSCLRRSNGSLGCWGANVFGEVGDGTQLQRLTPVAISGPWTGSGGAGVVDVEANWFGSCAIYEQPMVSVTAGAAQHSLACWGLNQTGQLGVGDQLNRLQPAQSISAGSDVFGVALGYEHSCINVGPLGLRGCTGGNSQSQACRADPASTTSFVACDDPLTGVLAIDAGSQHNCALTDTGGVACWGNNSTGQLGDGTTLASVTPITPTGLSSGMVQVVTSYLSSCALSDSGAVQCWGYNAFGQVGDGTTTGRTTPTAVIGAQADVVELAAGGVGTCARFVGGAVSCWGNNDVGQVGDGTSDNFRTTPTQVLGLESGVKHIAAGYDHRCALMTGGGLRCWGGNRYGEVGNGQATLRARAVPVVIDRASSPFRVFADGFEGAP